MRINASEERRIFWGKYDEELIRNGEPFKLLHQKGSEVTFWANVNKKKSLVDLSLSADFLIQKEILRINIYIRKDINLYDYLFSKKDEIEKQLGFSPIWNDNCKSPDARRIEVVLGFQAGDREDYDRLIEVSLPIMYRFKQVFEKYIPGLFDFEI